MGQNKPIDGGHSVIKSNLAGRPLRVRRHSFPCCSMEGVVMIVIETRPTIPDRARLWPANHPESIAKRRPRPADPHSPEDDGEPPLIPVASPPLIPRVFPGL